MATKKAPAKKAVFTNRDRDDRNPGKEDGSQEDAQDSGYPVHG